MSLNNHSHIKAHADPQDDSARKETPRERLLAYLKHHGPQTTTEAGAAMGITVEAARQQLQRLVSEQLVTVETVPASGRGRPQKRWGLTSLATTEFPDAHADVLVGLIQCIQEEFGAAPLQRVICHHSERVRLRYEEALKGCSSVSARIVRLAELRRQDGYMATSEQLGAGLFRLTENHCPIHSAASSCEDFCCLELQMFQQLLGPEVTVRRSHHAMSGDRCCAYEMTVGPDSQA
ncbi:helix-turn-helix transcriptional regulator [Gynuella sp.]|uniref:helix-turn-helix transcriptional regulator n=1 Tax=Gynuella sp. TaxID=2969146 RepID=UPI003D0991A6